MKGNPVNEDIYNTIKERATNEFALFNNGLTMLSDDTSFNERIGQKDRAQIIISNPQLINGGQTSFTLSRIYEEVLEGTTSSSVFNGKEVLLKIITFGETASSDESKKRKLIEEISKATNKQSEVSDADRRSNDKVQIDLQEKLFEEYGYYYERKKGEFASGIREKYLKREQIIDREQFLRIAICCDIKPSVAQSGAKLLQKHFDEHMQHMLCRYDEYFYGYLVYQSVLQVARECEKDKNDKYGVRGCLKSLRVSRIRLTCGAYCESWQCRSLFQRSWLSIHNRAPSVDDSLTNRRYARLPSVWATKRSGAVLGGVKQFLRPNVRCPSPRRERDYPHNHYRPRRDRVAECVPVTSA
jgi:AIPR protein